MIMLIRESSETPKSVPIIMAMRPTIMATKNRMVIPSVMARERHYGHAHNNGCKSPVVMPIILAT
jgi:hypothetical protein